MIPTLQKGQVGRYILRAAQPAGVTDFLTGAEGAGQVGSLVPALAVLLGGTGVAGGVGTVAPTEFFTSILYPLQVDDEIKVSLALPIDGLLWGTPDDFLDISAVLVDGTLEETIVYKTYNNTIEDTYDELKVDIPSLVDGDLEVVIVYKVYDNFVPDELKIDLPSLVDGDIEVVIAYITYSNFVADELKIELPTLVDGTLV